MKNFSIILASVPDRSNLVAEIWHDNRMIAELKQENEQLQIEFYLNEPKSFDYLSFCEILKEAEEKLLKK